MPGSLSKQVLDLTAKVRILAQAVKEIQMERKPTSRKARNGSSRAGKQAGPLPAGREWLDDVYGKFAGDSIFEEAMEIGRKYRKSLRARKGTRPSGT